MCSRGFAILQGGSKLVSMPQHVQTLSCKISEEEEKADKDHAQATSYGFFPLCFERPEGSISSISNQAYFALNMIMHESYQKIET